MNGCVFRSYALCARRLFCRPQIVILLQLRRHQRSLLSIQTYRQISMITRPIGHNLPRSHQRPGSILRLPRAIPRLQPLRCSLGTSDRVPHMQHRMGRTARQADQEALHWTTQHWKWFRCHPGLHVLHHVILLCRHVGKRATRQGPQEESEGVHQAVEVHLRRLILRVLGARKGDNLQEPHASSTEGQFQQLPQPRGDIKT